MYVTTKAHCQKMIDARMPIVCSSCGGKIEPIETVDNADNPTYWSGCMALNCHCFDYGTKPKTFKIAEKMVKIYHFTAYGHDPEPDKLTNKELYNYWMKCQIRGTVRIVEKILRLNDEIK